jgi:hypothetical protein
MHVYRSIRQRLETLEEREREREREVCVAALGSQVTMVCWFVCRSRLLVLTQAHQNAIPNDAYFIVPQEYLSSNKQANSQSMVSVISRDRCV